MPDSNSSHNPLGSLPINTLLPKFAIPSIVAYLVTSLYNIVDQIFIGQGVGYLGTPLPMWLSPSPLCPPPLP